MPISMLYTPKQVDLLALVLDSDLKNGRRRRGTIPDGVKLKRSICKALAFQLAWRYFLPAAPTACLIASN